MTPTFFGIAVIATAFIGVFFFIPKAPPLHRFLVALTGGFTAGNVAVIVLLAQDYAVRPSVSLGMFAATAIALLAALFTRPQQA